MTLRLVCKVGDADYYGNDSEYVAAHLDPGDRVLFDGSESTVRTVWFYEGPTVDLEDGRTIFPALGDTFHVLTPNA